jgi:Uma2 family endonuclease
MGRMREPERVKWRVTDFHRMSEAGILAPDDRVELIGGEILKMAPIGSAHAWTVDRLAAVLVLALGERAHVSAQNPVVLSEHDEPQPDLMVLRAPASRYRAALPRSDDVLLVIEVADTTIKLPLYARHRIPEVWIVDLPAARLIAFTGSDGASYTQRRELAAKDRVSPVFLPDIAIALGEILAP